MKKLSEWVEKGVQAAKEEGYRIGKGHFYERKFTQLSINEYLCPLNCAYWLKKEKKAMVRDTSLMIGAYYLLDAFREDFEYKYDYISLIRMYDDHTSMTVEEFIERIKESEAELETTRTLLYA